jgi:uncharacterized protein YhjY with autotransporter beta-barrel domain/antitoxin component of RelBE/YafQ-DinJ toxin-antitoxin module
MTRLFEAMTFGPMHGLLRVGYIRDMRAQQSLRARGFRGVAGKFLGIVAALFAKSALAVAPTISTGPVSITIPPVNQSTTVNLRQLGVISGTAPIQIEDVQMLVNGQTTAVLVATVLRTGELGAVCVTIRNADFSPTQGSIAMRLSVANAVNQRAGPTVVSVTNGPMPTPNTATCGDPNARPVANAGPDRTIPDSDGVAGETVVLNGSGSSDTNPGTVLTYQWSLVGGGSLGAASTSPTLSTRLQNGTHTVQLTVTDDSGDPQTSTATDTVQIVVNGPQPPTVNAGADRTIADTNNAPGETVTLTATASDPDGTIQSIVWRLGQTVLGTGATIQAPLSDGPNDVVVTATDNSGLTASDTVRITVTAPQLAPTIDAGPDRTVADTNGVAGETVTLTATASDQDGTIQSIVWQIGETILGAGATIQAALQDGPNDIVVTATDNSGLTASDTVRVTVGEPLRAPTVNAGADRVVPDTDGQPGEAVTLTATASDPDGTIQGYVWQQNGQQLGTGATLQTRLDDGVNQVTVTVTDNSGLTASDTVQITVGATQAPTVDAGADRSVADTNGQPGEVVALTATASDADGSIQSYTWRRGETIIGAGATIQAPLPDGINDITVTVTDDVGLTASDTVRITVLGPSAPTVNAGPDQTVADTDGGPGELVTLNGSATDSDGTIASYQWLQDQTVLASTATAQVRLQDGVNVLTLRVVDNAGNVGTDTVQITVNAAVVLPTANAGADRTINDTDRQPGETLTLTGIGTTRSGTIASYQWFREGQLLGTGSSLQVRLPDGVNAVTLVVTNSLNLSASDIVQITVAEPPVRIALAELPGLDPTQKSTAQSLDRICERLDRARVTGEGLTIEQRDLNRRCDALYFGNTSSNQAAALSQLVTDDFAVARTQTLLFANTQYASVMDRLMALRGGARGLSLAGLNILIDGVPVPLAQLQEFAGELLGGGASADSREPGGLLNDKVGLWARGNYSFGDKDANATSPGFDANQWALVGGMDYRITDNSVVGGALAYGNANVEFGADASALDTRSWALSLYGSMYAGKDFYLDAILNAADAGYEAQRNIAYIDGAGLVDENAQGSTDGMTLSAGVSAGYDFLLGRLTMSPSLGVFYVDASIKSFAEKGASGLNLIYDKQDFKSLTGNLGLRMTYSVNVPWGVLLPQLRIDYVREFQDDLDIFSVRFAADPDGANAPPILIETENPDQSYWRLAAGVSTQLPFGISAYVEYQRLESFEFISFQDVSVGIRAQRSF